MSKIIQIGDLSALKVLDHELRIDDLSDLSRVYTIPHYFVPQKRGSSL